MAMAQFGNIPYTMAPKQSTHQTKIPNCLIFDKLLNSFKP